MTRKQVPNLILKNFGEAAPHYSQEAQIQKTFAWLLAKVCSKETIPQGIWADLGAGTGLLAEALEALNPNQSVLRVDGSTEMLSQHSPNSKTQLWDLNSGLPTWPREPTLIASNFALHWLTNPRKRIQEWFKALTPGGWLALTVPVEGSFKEWHLASKKTGLPCTAMSLPSHCDLIEALHPESIRHEQLHTFTQKASRVYSLLKPMVKVGAQGNQRVSMNVGEWRKLQRAWPCCKQDKSLTLTWFIQVLLVQR